MNEYTPTFITSHLLLVYLGITAIISAIEIILTVLTPSHDHLSIVGFVCVSISLACLVLGLFKWMVILVVKKRGFDEVKRCKIDLLIGFGGIFVSSVVPRIMCFIIDIKENKIYFWLPLIPMFFFYSFFIYNAEKPIYGLPWNEATEKMILSFFAHFIILVVTVRTGVVLGLPQEPQLRIQFVYSVPCLTSSIEFLIIADNGLKMATPEQRERKNQWKMVPVFPQEDCLDPPMSELSLYAATFLAISLALTTPFLMIFVPVSARAWMIFGATILLCLLIFGLFKLSKRAIKRMCETWSELEEIAQYLVVGNSTCALIGLLARVGMFLFGSDVEMLCSFLFICFFTTIIAQYIFSFSPRKRCNVDHLNNVELIFLIITLNSIALLIGYGFACDYERKVDRDIRIVSQFVFFFLSFSSFIDFFVALRGGVYLKKNVEDVLLAELLPIQPAPSLDPAQTAPIALKPLPRIMCKMCYQPYSEAKIPRILKECGHTFCETCIDSKLKSSGQRYIACTTCQSATLIKGSASKLKKNFTIMNILEKNEK